MFDIRVVLGDTRVLIIAQREGFLGEGEPRL